MKGLAELLQDPIPDLDYGFLLEHIEELDKEGQVIPVIPDTVLRHGDIVLARNNYGQLLVRRYIEIKDRGIKLLAPDIKAGDYLIYEVNKNCKIIGKIIMEGQSKQVTL